MPDLTRMTKPQSAQFHYMRQVTRRFEWDMHTFRTAAVHQTRSARPFVINAWVVLPDHMHCIWTLPEGDRDFSTRMAAIKSRFSRCLPEGPIRASHILRRENGIWQRRFWERHIRDDAELAAHIQYCWHNPVKHGLVDHPKDWTYSSYHRDNRPVSQSDPA
jgi:putative transposase